MALPVRLNALTNTVLPVNAAAGPGPTTLKAITIYNPAAAASYIQLFDAAMVADVTLGTTKPTLSIGLPTAQTLSWPLPPEGIQFTNGLLIAATTTATGSSAPATAVDVNLVV